MSNYGFTSAGTSYDDEDRLTGFARASGTFTQSWSLTSVGDWNSITTNGTAQNRTPHMLPHARQPFPDCSCSFSSSSLSPPASGLLPDFDNKLKSADVDNNGSNDVTFQYDALGRRVARQGTSGSFVYVQHDQQTIADYGYGDAPSSPTHRYVYASYIDEPVVRKAAGTSGTLHYYHRNQQFSITAVTTSSGSVAERYDYTAYGQPTILDGSGSVLSSSAINNRYTYTGREWDQTLGLYHFRARWMSGLAGRFMGRDPIGYEGGTAIYSIRIMLNNGDPTGNDVFCFVYPCPGFGGVESVEIKDVSSVNDKRGDGNCGDKRRRWTFRANRSDPPASPDGLQTCEGYIVQKVTVTCEKSACVNQSCGKSFKSDSFTYFEAWYVGTGNKSPAERIYTDEALTPPGFVATESCGTYTQSGEVKFFCSSVTGDLGKPGVPGGIWNLGVNHGNGVCNTHAGKLPSSAAQPTWWAEEPVIVSSEDGKWTDRSVSSSFREMNTTWDCCCAKKDRGAKTTSSPR